MTQKGVTCNDNMDLDCFLSKHSCQTDQLTSEICCTVFSNLKARKHE
jgi:hypothetical protein